MALTALTFLSIALAGARHSSTHWPLSETPTNTTALFDNTTHYLLLGSSDPFFCFLVPLFGLMCIAICTAINYTVLILETLFATLYSLLRSSRLQKDDEATRSPSAFAVSSTRKRIITTSILLSLVSTIIPYHFAYLVLCIVHLATTVRALRLARATSTNSESNANFYNYAHSIFILMLWILPINLPVLVVWIRNLAVHWLTPFSSHHNVLAVMPFILLVETLSTGRMVPRAGKGGALGTQMLLCGVGAYAAVHGVSFAYVLHHLVNGFCAWVVGLYFDLGGGGRDGVWRGSWEGGADADGREGVGREVKKRP